MKKVVNLAVLCSTIISLNVQAKVIYGEDNRKEVHQASALHQTWALSAATMIGNENIQAPNADGTVDLVQTSFQGWLEAQGDEEESEKEIMSAIKNLPADDEEVKLTFCPGERFVEQPNPGMCSGFLIAPDLLVTAGHCGELPDACSAYKWVFDYKVSEETGLAGVNVKPENIYTCKKIVSISLSLELGTDYTVIQLDRQVTGREPLDLRFDGGIADKAEIVVIGNPSGLPLKVTDKANVRSNTDSMFFSANLDTFQGNSGSAVFNAATGLVEGILVRGEEDFAYNVEKSCLASNKCADDACRGEDVSRITQIPEVALKNLIDALAEAGDSESLDKILKLKVWVDFNGKDGKSALMKAAAAGMNASIVTLLANGAEVNRIDANGDTALHHLARVLTPENAQALTSLVSAEAKLDLKNKEGMTPMMLADLAGNCEGAKLLLQAGAKE